MTHFSVYDGVLDTVGVQVSFDTVVARIRTGGNGLDKKTRDLNKWYSEKPVKYKERKSELPAVTWSGTFPKGQRKHTSLLRHSGYVVLDIDDRLDLGSVLADFAQNPHVRFAFVSPSGQGVKPVIPVSPVPRNPEEHTHAFFAVLDAFDEYVLRDPKQIKAQKEANRLCFLAFDPNPVDNPNAIPIEWDATEALTDGLADAVHGENGSELTDNATRQTAPAGSDTRCPSLEEAKAVLSFLDADCDYETWLHIGMGCHAGGVPFEVWDAWSSQGSKYNESEMPAKWASFRGSGITWGTVVHLAKQNGYEPPRTARKPVKLQKNIVSVITETLAQSREFLRSVFSDKKIKFFGLRADTGVGKSEGMIAFLMRGFSGLITVPTTDLAKELEKRFNAAEVNGVFRYRGILSDPDGAFPDENPCIHAVRYDAIASRGWNAYNLLCESCEVREMCEEHGYRSQASRAKEAQVTVMPFPDIFLNPAFRSLAKEFLPTYSDDLILHDEFDPYKAFLEIELPKSRLQQMRDDWEGYDVSTFAKEILRILEVDGDMSELRKLVMGLTASERDAIREGLTCVMWRGQVLSREEAHRCYEFIAKIHNTERILTLPRLETDDWNLIAQLELFFERYPRDADMPMKYENNTLTFLLPPLPMKTRARMGFMSATLNENIFRRTFSSRQEKRGNVAFHDTGLTEWHPEARVYQLRTNRNPRITVYHPKKERDDGLLSATGRDYWDLISDDLKNENRGLISYKALLAEKTSELEGIQTANFGGLVGLDTHFKDVEVLHILFSPEIPPGAVDFKAKALFGDDTEPLSFERDKDGQYVDQRLQVCYDSGVISELEQAIGRGRLVSRPVTAVVWCSHYLPGITDRDQTRLFDEVEWQEAGGHFAKLHEIIAMRETGDVAALAAATGKSARTARRQTEQARKQTKTKRDIEIQRRDAEGETQAEIASSMNVGLATVNRVLKKFQNGHRS